MAIITICMGVFCHGYFMGSCLSLHGGIDVYGASNSTDRQDLIDSFTAYCKSRNLLVNGSVLGSAAEWTGTTIEQIISLLGIDMDYLQSQISKEVSSNFGVRYALTSTGIGLYNRIFAELLQREELEVNDTNVDKKVYSGKIFTDADGNKCLVYVLPKMTNWNDSSSKPLYYGSVYKYDYKQLIRLYEAGYRNPVYRVSASQTDTTVFYKDRDEYYDPIYGFFREPAVTEQVYAKSLSSGNVDLTGSRIIGCLESNPDVLYFGSLNYMGYNDNPDFPDYPYYGWSLFWVINDSDSEPTDVDVKTPDDKPIKPSLPDDKPINIYPSGDTDHDTGDDNPGGGGGDNPGGYPDNWNPTTPSIPTPTNPNFPTVELPDIDIPNLPSLNFSLGDLRNKFPFSLPFDIITVLNVLDGEPQAPHIEATVPIGKWYTWEMDFDFSEFDNYARIFRAFEFIGFCIGLAIFTVHFVKG